MTGKMFVYRHRQPGYAVIAVFAAIMIFYILFLSKTLFSTDFIILTGVVSVSIILFQSQKVEIDDKIIKISMGVGLISKKINLKDIKAGSVVKNKWYAGWGIKLVPKGIMFNVSGLDAVELVLKNGNVFRIGTDEPEKLQITIQNLINR